MNYIAFLAYITASSFTPGPNNIMSMTNAGRDGLKRTFHFICGVGAGFFVLMLLTSYLNLVLYKFIPTIQFVMNILGGLYMVYLAIKIMRSKPQTNAQSGPNALNSFFIGFILQFVNPKGILYGITTISTFIIPFYKTHLSLVLFALLLAFVGFLSTFTWALFGSLLQRFLSKYERPFNVLMGLVLLYCAVSIFV